MLCFLNCVNCAEHTVGISTVGSMLKRMLTGGLGSGYSQEVPILRNVSGTLRPGTTTLLLAPSGHGKSTLLKALAGRIHSSKLCGNIWYGGELIEGVNTRRLGTAPALGRGASRPPSQLLARCVRLSHVCRPERRPSSPAQCPRDISVCQGHLERY